MKPVRKAIFPVAGQGTRFLPATKAMPKEMLPVVDRPLIQYAVDEARAAGIEELIFVTGRGKQAIEDYFDIAYELEASLHAKGKIAMLDLLADSRLEPGRACFIRQQEPLGLGHAVWCARDLIGNEPFAVLLPDELLWNPKQPSLCQLVETYNIKGGNVVTVMEVPEAHTHRYGIIDPDKTEGDVHEVKGLVEKPETNAPSRLAMVGRYILQPEIMDLLAEDNRGVGGEIQLTDAMAQLIGQYPFHACRFDGIRHDCGDKAGFIQANVALALERPDIGPAVREYLKHQSF
ncbi:MAG: UTP--glucose-1-phosphate uridylyltransferase GalU [Zymomonas mobilis subsp. pomaceae]|uniref:UTP--glucose-1-phosphate uridylyltransferase n=1 Tax=Zymomonas mobilis subsp. pomaceae (strain ATCC 29192 / DSM 22645 / JCM 10191 / CCUG 17912 / NBRC 13757 / NCIMB 11200 / NRRL B-4491 / Barker I) TaxID=579138 RepID=F8EV31_ZYMMT|nr:UTP--glucose-1-phosphate uridylyltransferase GalU [Zymomonas mobilis]AEI38249.1 UTP-glucose-1-phosphate uridylyltransferase [Zymomonas mobilis subsp. pomaceae ATCC 29192]MDX5947938.1 UTP--glucose-1-phosphate uridylyltransferase GalU [Zymomonas mobilis subsp. pomaceae]GEB89267.1 UTP--glucose-1-phosphate uridylyltransferase [Zymomonas mobilis subsp. pomaceae]